MRIGRNAFMLAQLTARRVKRIDADPYYAHESYKVLDLASVCESVRGPKALNERESEGRIAKTRIVRCTRRVIAKNPHEGDRTRASPDWRWAARARLYRAVDGTNDAVAS